MKYVFIVLCVYFAFEWIISRANWIALSKELRYEGDLHRGCSDQSDPFEEEPHFPEMESGWRDAIRSKNRFCTLFWISATALGLTMLA